MFAEQSQLSLGGKLFKLEKDNGVKIKRKLSTIKGQKILRFCKGIKKIAQGERLFLDRFLKCIISDQLTLHSIFIKVDTLRHVWPALSCLPQQFSNSDLQNIDITSKKLYYKHTGMLWNLHQGWEPSFLWENVKTVLEGRDTSCSRAFIVSIFFLSRELFLLFSLCPEAADNFHVCETSLFMKLYLPLSFTIFTLSFSLIFRFLDPFFKRSISRQLLLSDKFLKRWNLIMLKFKLANKN